PQKELTLAPITKKLLKEVPFPVTVRGFYNEDERANLKNLFELYALASNKFKYELFNLDRNPGLAKKYGVSSYNSAVVEVNGKLKNIIYPSEEKIINAILALTNPTPKAIYFLSGHGEYGLEGSQEEVSYGRVKEALETENYRIKKLLFVDGKPIPDDASVVVIGGPKTEFSQSDLNCLDEYWKRGGSVVLALDPGKERVMKDYLKTYGIVLGDDIVIDPEDYLTEKGPLVPLIPFYFTHPITEKFTIPTVFPLVCSVTKGSTLEKNVTLSALARSGEQSWAETDVEKALEGKYEYDPKTDQKGPITIAMVGEIKKEQPSQEGKKDEKTDQPKSGKMVVFGDADFLLNQYFELLGNKDLFLNTIHWMTEEESLITIRQKKPSAEDERPVFLSQIQSRIIFIGVVILQPIIILAVGMVVAWRRRQRG
ncbi:MAG TPA: Gldg family protein, partial [Thermodesulfobacteriota bacterium]|nr:Gldg family protein [Thermodesulfobacteriota bacterium]